MAVGDAVGAPFRRFLAHRVQCGSPGLQPSSPRAAGRRFGRRGDLGPPGLRGWAHALMAEAMQERCEVDTALHHACAEQKVEHVALLLGRGADRFRAMSIAGSIAALVRGFPSILRRQPPLPGVDLVSASLRSAADGHGVTAYLYRFLSGLDHLRRDDFASALVDLEAADFVVRCHRWMVPGQHPDRCSSCGALLMTR